MSETKFKRVISLANATLLNMTRDAMDGEITNEEFVNIMFVCILRRPTAAGAVTNGS